MKVRVAILFLFVFSSCFCFGQNVFRLYSKEVEDSFDIYINAGPIDTSKPVRYIYYADGGIRLGSEIRRQLAELPASTNQNKVFVGIAHLGNFHQKRRRDYIPPAPGSDGGHADRFYRLMATTLFAKVEQFHSHGSSRSLIGHSFSGLFTIYSLLREDRMFDRFYALSPSLWMNKYAILDQEASFHQRTSDLSAYLYLSCGTAETLNYILAGNRRLRKLLDDRNYHGLRVGYDEFPGKTHNSQVPNSVAAILNGRD